MLSVRENYCPDQVTFSGAEPSHPTTLVNEIGICWKLRHTQYSSHWNDGFGATHRVYCIDLSKFYSSGDPPLRGGVRLALSLRP
jgi:hypothetical protein